jgi:sterol desaturase/sphingolipid hydroxylase (fatty acid hydroxylase superfamily)
MRVESNLLFIPLSHDPHAQTRLAGRDRDDAMSWAFLREASWQFFLTLWHVVPWLLVMGVIFSALTVLSPCNEGRPWWRKRGLGTDLTYWIFAPVFSRYLRIWATVIGTMAIFGITGADAIAQFYDHGHGAVGRLPLWAQGALYLVATDFALYWIHRGFHNGILWKYHAVHHVSKDVEWISAARFHPVNLAFGTCAVDIAALLSGISPEIFIVLGPFTTVASVFVHANLDWTLGPLKYLVVSPVFHRWHHVNRIRDKNFASTFALWDWLFGTYYMPKGALPSGYGIDDERMPEGFVPQLLYPLQQGAGN